MSDGRMMLRVPKPLVERQLMELITLRIAFQPSGNLDGCAVLYEKQTGVAFDCSYGPGIIIEPEFDSMAVVCYGQNPQKGDLAWCCISGPAYMKMATNPGESDT